MGIDSAASTAVHRINAIEAVTRNTITVVFISRTLLVETLGDSRRSLGDRGGESLRF
jgi:hypothetical protein